MAHSSDSAVMAARTDQGSRPSPASHGKAPRTARGERTLRKILDAALHEFGERGFADASIVGIRRIPRLRTEYQISRPIFVRFVGEYNSDWQDDLRDDSRSNLPIYIFNPATGRYDRAAKQYLKTFRSDWLFSYQPTPGTVLFAGYGNTLADLDDDYRTRRLQRTTDGFFVKFSYLFRL